jgi:hypothetical protein
MVSTFKTYNTTYAATDKSFHAGYMGTFIGMVKYPSLNTIIPFLLFTNGPFQNAGVKVQCAISDKVGIMVGAFNDARFL